MKNKKVLVLTSIVLIAMMSVLFVACTTASGLEQKFKKAGYEVTKTDGTSEDNAHWIVTAKKKNRKSALDLVPSIFPGIAELKKYDVEFMAVKFKNEKDAQELEKKINELLDAVKTFGAFKDKVVTKKGTVVYFGNTNEIDYALGKKISL